MDQTPTPRLARRVGVDLAILAVIGALLVAAFAAAGAVLYRDLYSPSAFVLRYANLLAEGRAADALATPGVGDTTSGDLPATASEALLRRDALAGLTDITAVSEEAAGEVTRVTLAYTAGGVGGRTAFEVTQDGWAGVAPTWRFAESPLAVIDLTVRGSMRFDVNGFEIDKRQVSADGADADALAPVSLLVFSPGLYSVAVDTAISATPGAAVLADVAQAAIPVELQAQPTEEFLRVVQGQVDEFLTTCATQQVLQPTGCPFGLQVRNRIVDAPTWSIVRQPAVSISPDAAGWRIEPADAVAHVDVRIQSLFDGSVRPVSQDVPFRVEGTIEVRPDGAASIRVSGGNID